jgi:pantetheine-phosphate adenylyltransferase
MLAEVCAPLPNVTVSAFEGLLVNYAVEQGARVIVRGLRAVTDFEYELQMALMNRRLSSAVETVFMMTGAEYSFLSSSMVKQIARLGGSVEGLVPNSVGQRLRQKVKNV